MRKFFAALLVSLLLVAPARAEMAPGWEALVAAAKKEGALALSAPSGRAWREQLMLFQAAYPEIKLSVSPSAGRDFWPRLLKEREAGQYLWDLRVGGSDEMSYRLLHMGVFAPIRPLFLLPEILDDSKWLGGLDGVFLDLARTHIVGFAVYESQNIYYNQRLLPEAAGLPLETLTDPRYAGKISMADPRGGASLNTLAVMTRAYGGDYVEKLFVQQKPVISKEPRQQMDWLASGRYAIAFGLPSIAFVEYSQRGGQVGDFEKATGLRSWSSGVGGIHLPTNAPHPAASQLFVNWILSREVQGRLMQAVQLNSRRLDVPPGAPDMAIEPGTIDAYYGQMNEEILPFQEKTVEILRRVLK